MQPQDQQQPYYPPREQPVYRFPQNRPSQGWQPQQNYPPQSYPQPAPVQPVQPEAPREERGKSRRPRKRRRVFTWWNLFALIGIGTVLVEVMRYLVIPLLMQLNNLTGGAL